MELVGDTTSPRVNILGGLSLFSDALSQKIGTFDKNIVKVVGSIDANSEAIVALRATVANHEREMKHLNNELDDHRAKIEFLMSHIKETEKRFNGDGSGTASRPKSGYVQNSGRLGSGSGAGGSGGGGGGGAGSGGGGDEYYGGGGGARSVSSALGKPTDLLNPNILVPPSKPLAYNPELSEAENFQAMANKVRTVEDLGSKQAAISKGIAGAITDLRNAHLEDFSTLQRINIDLEKDVAELKAAMLSTDDLKKLKSESHRGHRDANNVKSPARGRGANEYGDAGESQEYGSARNTARSSAATPKPRKGKQKKKKDKLDDDGTFSVKSGMEDEKTDTSGPMSANAANDILASLMGSDAAAEGKDGKRKPEKKKTTKKSAAQEDNLTGEDSRPPSSSLKKASGNLSKQNTSRLSGKPSARSGGAVGDDDADGGEDDEGDDDAGGNTTQGKPKSGAKASDKAAAARKNRRASLSQSQSRVSSGKDRGDGDGDADGGNDDDAVEGHNNTNRDNKKGVKKLGKAAAAHKKHAAAAGHGSRASSGKGRGHGDDAEDGDGQGEEDGSADGPRGKTRTPKGHHVKSSSGSKKHDSHSSRLASGKKHDEDDEEEDSAETGPRKAKTKSSTGKKQGSNSRLGSGAKHDEEGDEEDEESAETGPRKAKKSSSTGKKQGSGRLGSGTKHDEDEEGDEEVEDSAETGPRKAKTKSSTGRKLGSGGRLGSGTKHDEEEGEEDEEEDESAETGPRKGQKKSSTGRKQGSGRLGSGKRQDEEEEEDSQEAGPQKGKHPNPKQPKKIGQGVMHDDEDHDENAGEDVYDDDDEEEDDDEDESDDENEFDEDDEDENFDPYMKDLEEYELELDGLSMGSSQVGGVAGVQLVARVKRDLVKRIEDMEADVKKHHLFSYLIADIRSTMEHTKTRMDRFMASINITSLLNDSVFKKIEECGILWTKVYGELLFGLENLKNDVGEESFNQSTGKLSADDAVSAESGDESSAVSVASYRHPTDKNDFLFKCTELVKLIESGLELFKTVNNSLPLTLERLDPHLEKIFQLAQELLSVDSQVQNDLLSKEAMDLNQFVNFVAEYSFNDVLCSDMKPNMRKLVEDAIDASYPVLDESITKVDLQKKLFKMEKVFNNMVLREEFDKFESDIRKQIKFKIGQDDFLAATSKFASTAEMNNMKMKIMDSIHTGALAHSRGNPQDTAQIAANVEEIKDLKTRFELLTKQYVDVQSFCGQFIPREEVHEVMRTVVAEVKLLKNNCVRESLFNEALKKKADADELQGVIVAITSAIGDFNLQENTDGNYSSAVHAKCLLCDKPVLGVLNNLQKKNFAAAGKPKAENNSPPGNRPISSIFNKNSLQSQSVSSLKDKMQLQGAFPQLVSASSDKVALVVDSLPNFRPRTSPNNNNIISNSNTDKEVSSSMLGRLGSHNSSISKAERAKVVSELSVLRNSIDVLPEINDNAEIANMLHSSNTSLSGMPPSYKQRIRSSAGGGMGGSYK